MGCAPHLHICTLPHLPKKGMGAIYERLLMFAVCTYAALHKTIVCCFICSKDLVSRAQCLQSVRSCLYLDTCTSVTPGSDQSAVSSYCPTLKIWSFIIETKLELHCVFYCFNNQHVSSSASPYLA